ncbi:MAG TPA: hypothetical protein VKA43_00790 [Gammaproteobacteria bacterium]|nr:hypothetical protein [Gammaproteobacteria bacterium]
MLAEIDALRRGALARALENSLGMAQFDTIRLTAFDDGHCPPSVGIDGADSPVVEVNDAALVGSLPGELDQKRFRDFDQPVCLRFSAIPLLSTRSYASKILAPNGSIR